MQTNAVKERERERERKSMKKEEWQQTDEEM